MPIQRRSTRIFIGAIIVVTISVWEPVVTFFNRHHTWSSEPCVLNARFSIKNETHWKSQGDKVTKALSSSSHRDETTSFRWEGLNYTDSCFYVEDICHTSHRWYYRRNPHSDTIPRQHQPNVRFQLNYGNPESSHHEWSPYRVQYRFEHPDDVNATSHCTESSVTNHFVLYNLYNDMLGEFYDRGLVHLYKLSQQADWVRESQLYIHLYDMSRRLLDSHHIFTAPFRRKHPLMDFATLLDETHCTCLPRLIFCGYEQKPISDSNDEIVVTPGLDWDILGRRYGGTSHRDLRRFLRKSLIEDNVHVQDDIRRYRTMLFDQFNVTADERDQWKIVGLAQRNGRRRWVDLRYIIRLAQPKAFQSKMILVEMNVEVDSSSYSQVVRHGALDGLVGIHGAQLTEAIWMKDGSWVVELLPYIPDGIQWGSWTKVTHMPTPLGQIFKHTELNHVGYPLKRDSAPYCQLPNEQRITCWQDWKWDDRDFFVDDQEFLRILTTWFTDQSNDCQANRDKAGNTFVLYNMNCADSADEPIGPHQYYWNATKSYR